MLFPCFDCVLFGWLSAVYVVFPAWTLSSHLLTYIGKVYCNCRWSYLTFRNVNSLQAAHYHDWKHPNSFPPVQQKSISGDIFGLRNSTQFIQLENLFIKCYLEKYLKQTRMLEKETVSVAGIQNQILHKRSNLFDLILSQQITTKMPYASSLDPDETPSYSASHPDPSFLILKQHLTNFGRLWGTLQIEPD